MIVALPASLAVLLLAAGCAKQVPAPVPTAAAPEPAATAATAEPATAPAAPAATAPAATAPAAAAAPATAIAAAAPAATASLEAGAKVFKTFCQTCHGPTGKGDGPTAAALNPKPADLADGLFKYDPNGNGTKGDIDDIKAIVHDGAAKHGGSPLMTPWPGLTPEQLQAVAQYVKSLHPG
jgi:mono/diheme cytochrome c family protein